jgi:large subunit ribosomal protein L17
MRHGKKFNHLKRKSAHRKALLRNLSIALITHKRITTTLAKAKALRKYIEPLVTKSKANTTHSRRVVFSYLQNKEAIKELFGPIADKVGDRPGGYVRVIKLGFRRSDGAEMAMIEFVDYNEVYNPNEDKGEGGGGRRRRRRRRGGGGSESTAADTTTETAAEEEEETEEEEDAADDIVDEVEETTEEETTDDTEEEKDEEEK